MGSQAVISALGGYATRFKLLDECKANLNRLSESNKHSVEWVPGLSEISGKEKTDRQGGALSRYLVHHSPSVAR